LWALIRMVTLTGAGGVGKTQTALHVALTVEESGHGLRVLHRRSRRSGIRRTSLPRLHPHWACRKYRIGPLLETLGVFLKNRALFLVLDNYEHVIAEAVEFAAESLLKACPRIRESWRPVENHYAPPANTPTNCQSLALLRSMRGALCTARATPLETFGAIRLF